jgi:hypothetical protein
MGTHSYGFSCPNCEKEMNCCSDTRNPFTSGECLHCGYYFFPKEQQMSLKELNELRADFELKPLKSLPKWEV